MSPNLFQIWDMELAAKLRLLRDKRGVSEREVSRAISKAAPEHKASPTTVGRWFSGTGMPSFIQAVELANYFGVPISYLAYDDAASAPAELPEDEVTVLKFYRILKRTRGLDEELAVAGMSSVGRDEPQPDAADSGRPQPPPGIDPSYRHPAIPSEPWEGIRDHTAERAAEEARRAKAAEKRKPRTKQG